MGVGRGGWLALMCALNNPKNYSSVSVFQNSPYNAEAIPLKPMEYHMQKSYNHNKSKHLSILVENAHSTGNQTLLSKIRAALNELQSSEYNLESLDYVSPSPLWETVQRRIEQHFEIHSSELN